MCEETYRTKDNAGRKGPLLAPGSKFPQDKLIIIAGPTASGKSGAAVALAKRIHGSVISADSMQVYRGMDIGTAKITRQEMQGIPHYLIDILDPKDEWNVVLFQQRAKEAIREIRAQGRIPILCGGTGFYIQALLYDIHFSDNDDGDAHASQENKKALPVSEDKTQDPAVSDKTKGHAAGKDRRAWWQQEVQARGEAGPAWLHAQLERIDPASAAAIPQGNVRRMIRALEYYEQTGEPISAHNEAQHQRQAAYEACYFVLTMERPLLYERIDERVDQMMAQGLLDEVIRLKKEGLSLANQSMQGLGYRQLLEYLDGKCSLEEAVNQIKLQTRHFAKRQETWFRREKRRDPGLLTIAVAPGMTPDSLAERMYQEYLSCR